MYLCNNTIQGHHNVDFSCYDISWHVHLTRELSSLFQNFYKSLLLCTDLLRRTLFVSTKLYNGILIMTLYDNDTKLVEIDNRENICNQILTHTHSIILSTFISSLNHNTTMNTINSYTNWQVLVKAVLLMMYGK